MKRCTIFMIDDLQAMGMQQLLNASFDIQALIVHSIDDLYMVADIDIVFTDAITFTTHLKYFLPRQSRTIIITPQAVKGDSSVNIIHYSSIEELKASLIKFFQHEPVTTSGTSTLLSQREIDVLRLVVSGHINKEIADVLNISINTVLTHRKNITTKLGIKSVSGLSFYAMMNGIIAPQ